MKNIKEFIKNYKKEIVIGGTAVVIGGCAFLLIGRTPKATEIKLPLTATFLPNIEYGTVDLFIGKGSNRNHIWAFGLGEAQSLAVELNDAMSCVWPQD